jgi:DNA-directed RNA polymerase specialized sigma24 family protein
MSHDADIFTLPLDFIAQRCQQESERFFQQVANDPRYCYELFRRAIVQRISDAWLVVYTQYTPQVSGWVERHANFANCGEESAYFVNRAFEKMWSALNPDKFTHFPDLKSLLRYLQLCTHSVIIDHVRTRDHLHFAELLPIDHQDETDEKQGDLGIETHILAELERQRFWAHIQKRLEGEQEARLLYYRFVLDLKPRQICARFPEEFPDVWEVYKMIQKILDRLGRDADLKKFIDPDD